MKKLNTSVVICGAGPVGLTLAHLLDLEKIDVIVLDRLENTMTEPRAIAIDGESLRTLQKAGLLQGIEGELLSGLVADYINGKGEILFRAGRPELRPYGYPTVNAFDQPRFDRYLAETLAGRDRIQLWFNHTLDSFSQDEHGVRVSCTDASGEELVISADYLVGCDGGRSTVRSLLGVSMKGESNPQPWLVIDTRDPNLDNQLDCRFFCDPARPGMTIRKRHGERRWEWMLMPGEDREFLLDDANIRALLAPHTDVDQVDIYRRRVYDFHAIIADKWQEGRVFLAGDAAHMTPPFAGQGLNSGFRDVSNLSWKLAMVVSGRAHASILDSYEEERRDHAWELIETALNLGRQIQPTDPDQAAERDAFFAEVNRDPEAVRALEDEMFKSVMDRSLGKGLLVGPSAEAQAGRLLIQPEVRAGGKAVLLDQYLGTGFAIIGYNCDPTEVLGDQQLAQWRRVGTKIVRISTVAAQEDQDGIILDNGSELANWLGDQRPAVLLVRPDRFCMACACPAAAGTVLTEAYELLTAPQSQPRRIGAPTRESAGAVSISL